MWPFTQIARFFHRNDRFPPVALADVARHIPDADEATYAYENLQHLIKLGLAKVYMQHITRDWAVYLEGKYSKAWGEPGGERISLEEWCQRHIANEERWRRDIFGENWREVLGLDTI